MAETNLETVALTRRITIDKALQAAVNGVPALRALRNGSTPDEGGMNGFYDETGVFTEWFRVGMAVGSAPVRPARFQRY